MRRDTFGQRPLSRGVSHHVALMDFTFTWPITGLILGLVAIFAFRTSPMRLIDRTTKVGREGAAFERPQSGGERLSNQLSLVEVMSHPISASTPEREQTIKQHVTSSNLKTEHEQIVVLIRALALSRVETEFTRIASQIFGSQVSFLLQLAGTAQGLPGTHAETIFHHAPQEFPALHSERPYQEWLRYLQVYNLVRLDGDHIDITQYGADFLKHLVDARLTYSRYG